MKLSDKDLRLILLKRPGHLTLDDLRWLKPYHIPLLSPAHVAHIPLDTILALDAKQVAALTQEQVATLEPQMGIIRLRPKGYAANLARLENLRRDAVAAVEPPPPSYSLPVNLVLWALAGVGLIGLGVWWAICKTFNLRKPTKLIP